MGYFGGPNKALANPCFKRPKLVSFGKKRKIVKREKKRGGRGRREEEDGDQAKQSKGMETTLSMDFVWIT